MSLQFKFTSILATQKEEIDRNAVKVTVENMEMAQAELLAFLQDSIASAVRCTTDLNRHSIYLYVAEKHAKQPEEMLYLIKDTQEQITLTPAFTQEEPFFVEWGFQKPFAFKRKQKPVVVSEVEDAIAEAAVATHEGDVEMKERLIKEIRAVGKQIDLDTDTGIRNYAGFVFELAIELDESKHISTSTPLNVLETINLKLHEEFNKCMDVIKDIKVLDPEAEVKPGMGFTKLAIMRTHLREEKAASEGQMELFEEFMTTDMTPSEFANDPRNTKEEETVVENKEVVAVEEEVAVELDNKDTQIITLMAELEDKDEKLALMQKQLEEVMKKVEALSTTPAAQEVTAAQEPKVEAKEVPAMNEGRKVVLDAFARLVAKQMREAGHKGQIAKDDIVKWVNTNVEKAKDVMKDAEKEAMLEDIVRMPGFKSFMKYYNDNFKIMSPNLVKVSFRYLKTTDNKDIVAVVEATEKRFNNDNVAIAEFIKTQMGRFFGVDFKGMYKSGVTYTADAVTFLGSLHKTVFYAIGDAGEKAANAVAKVLYKHAGVDGSTRKNTVEKVFPKQQN